MIYQHGDCGSIATISVAPSTPSSHNKPANVCLPTFFFFFSSPRCYRDFYRHWARTKTKACIYVSRSRLFPRPVAPHFVKTKTCLMMGGRTHATGFVPLSFALTPPEGSSLASRPLMPLRAEVLTSWGYWLGLAVFPRARYWKRRRVQRKAAYIPKTGGGVTWEIPRAFGLASMKELQCAKNLFHTQ